MKAVKIWLKDVDYPARQLSAYARSKLWQSASSRSKYWDSYVAKADRSIKHAIQLESTIITLLPCTLYLIRDEVVYMWKAVLPHTYLIKWDVKEISSYGIFVLLRSPFSLLWSSHNPFEEFQGSKKERGSSGLDCLVKWRFLSAERQFQVFASISHQRQQWCPGEIQ